MCCWISGMFPNKDETILICDLNNSKSVSIDFIKRFVNLSLFENRSSFSESSVSICWIFLSTYSDSVTDVSSMTENILFFNSSDTFVPPMMVLTDYNESTNSLCFSVTWFFNFSIASFCVIIYPFYSSFL